MIKVLDMVRIENELSNTIRLEFPLKSPKYIGLTRNRLILEYPNVFPDLANIGETVIFSLLPIAFSESSNIQLPDSLSLEVGTFDRIDRIIALWNGWFQSDRKIKIIANAAVKTESREEKRFGAQLFSGGVDSLATFKRQRDNIKYLIFYNGADIRLTRPGRFQQVKNYLERFAQRYGKKLISITTNVHHLHSVSWEHVSHGCAMLGPVIALSKYINKVFIAATFSGPDSEKMPWGSHPLLDPMVRCEEIETIHDGFDLKRTEKVLLLNIEPELIKYIRACGANVKKGNNCGKCEKCYRTSVILRLLNIDPKETSFPKESFELDNISNFLSRGILQEHTKFFWSENLEFLESSKQAVEGKERLIAALKDFLGDFYKFYKKGFSNDLPKSLEYVSKWRRIEKTLRLRTDTLLWIKRFLKLLKRRTYERTFS
ncbi:MAG: hypothetical protein JSW40_09595 [Candidatus Omnitrophota bacterium]|nr:MAG: hypothetical protein JSW40_09595 [Candidatus Omnitrophota bacterium]